LTFSSANLSRLINIILGFFSWNIDHCPLFINVAFNLPQSYNKTTSRKFHEKNGICGILILSLPFLQLKFLK